MAYLPVQPFSQGEVTFFPVTPDHFDGAETAPLELNGNAWIVAHSEKGHHHVMECERADVVEIKHDVPGLRVLRAIVTDPEGVTVRNLGSHGHADLHLPPGFYVARLNRELGLDDMIQRSAD